jgi:diguanylate cyclase (GGDEF)-like protein
MGKNNRKRAVIYGSICIAVLAILAGLITYKQIEKSSATLLPYVSKGVDAELEATLFSVDSKLSHVETAERLVAELDWDSVTESEIYARMKVLTESTDGYLAIYLPEDGVGYNNKNERVDMTEKPYYDRIVESDGGVIFVESDEMIWKNAFIRIQKVEDGVGGKILVFIKADAAFDQMNKASFRGNSFYALLNGTDYEVIYAGGTLRNHSLLMDMKLWDNMKDSAVSDAKWSIFAQKIRSGYSAELECELSDSEVLVYARQIGTSTLWVLTAIDRAYFEEEEVVITQPLQALKRFLILIFVGFVGVFACVCVVMKKDSEKRAKELEGKADTDQLTGLTNKIATESQIRDYIARSNGHKGVMILVDVDNFKKINDTMGHAFGDDVLRQLGIRLRSLYRVSDIVGRIGGDEFVVFLKDINDEEVIARESRKLWTFFQGFEVGEYVKYSVTASLGAAVFPANGDTFESLYKSADTAVYIAKRGGKNRLVFYDEKEMAETKAKIEKTEKQK